MKSTAASLALKLGVSRVTIFSLKKRYPGQAPKDFGQDEKWRSFCLAAGIRKGAGDLVLPRHRRPFFGSYFDKLLHIGTHVAHVGRRAENNGISLVKLIEVRRSFFGGTYFGPASNYKQGRDELPRPAVRSRCDKR